MPKQVPIQINLGFAPDADPMTPGVITDCMNFVPTSRGMRALRKPIRYDHQTAIPATDSEPVGYATFKVLDVSDYNFVGTSAKLFTRDNVTRLWDDVSRTAGYTLVSTWTFERFGEFVIAAAWPVSAGTIVLQASDIASGSFANIAGAPTSSVVTSAERFVLAFNGRGGYQDAWNCCARDDHTSWTVNPVTLATAGRLVEPPGAIRAAIQFGNDVIAFKLNGMIRGRFVPGDSEVWKWDRLPFVAGASGPRAVCKLDDGRVAMMNAESCFIFDGSQVTDVLDRRARRWYSERRNSEVMSKYACFYDAVHNAVWYTFGTVDPADYTTDDEIDAIVYSLSDGKLGRVSMLTELIAEMPSGTLRPGARTVGFFGQEDTTQYVFPAYGGSDTYLGTDSGFSASFTTIAQPYLVTGDTGDAMKLVEVHRIRLNAPAREASKSLGAKLLSRDTVVARNESTVVGTAADAEYERFDVRATKHWHRVRIEATTGGVELVGIWLEGEGFDGARK